MELVPKVALHGKNPTVALRQQVLKVGLLQVPMAKPLRELWALERLYRRKFTTALSFSRQPYLHFPALSTKTECKEESAKP